MRSSVPLLVEWTPGAVRLVDPTTGAESRGATLAECAPPRGRDAVVAVGRRSVFLRTVPVPPASKAEVARVIAFGLAATLPLEPKEVVFGFRTGGDTAIVGAMRAESLERLHAEAQAAGLRVRAVLPVAFGAWLAARERSGSTWAVVEREDGGLSVDVLDRGELVYSRSVPGAALEDAGDEVARTFATAGVAPAKVLALASADLPADGHDPKGALLHLADLRTIGRLLFSFELPARREARTARMRRWQAQRACLAAGLALATSAYAYRERVQARRDPPPSGSLAASLQSARRERAAAEAQAAALARENRILDVAFGSAQSAADVVAAVANGTPPGAWITSLSVSRDAPVTVAGYALAGRDVPRFFRNVDHDPRFRRAQVVSTGVATLGKVPVVQFLISGDVVGTPPFDRPLRRAPKRVKAQPANR